MGLTLKNPLIVSSSSLAKDITGIKSLVAAGAAAIVLKSLFEEQLEAEVESYRTDSFSGFHTEAYDYIEHISSEFGPREYLELISRAKKEISIPIIASINCINPKQWSDYAAKIAAAGADGLELNIAFIPFDPDIDGPSIEAQYLKTIEKVKKTISIPIAVKLGFYFSSLPNFLKKLDQLGVDAVVLFNRFYQFDIDVELEKLKPGYLLSTSAELHLALRWIALMSHKVNCDLAATTGIHSGADVIKVLLAGAKTAQLCSTLFINGPDQIGRILAQLDEWMKKKNYQQICEFQGKLNQLCSQHPDAYERIQYIQALVGID